MQGNWKTGYVCVIDVKHQRPVLGAWDSLYNMNINEKNLCWHSVNDVNLTARLIVLSVLSHNGESLADITLPSPQVIVPQPCWLVSQCSKALGTSKTYTSICAHLIEKTGSDKNNASVEKRWALNWDKHTQRQGETVEVQLEFERESMGAIGGAQRKEDRKKYWQSLDIHISHPTRPACSLYFIVPLCAGGTAWQASSFNGKYGPSLPSRLLLRYHSCFLSIPPDIILSPLGRALFSIILLFLSSPFSPFYWCSTFHPSCFTPLFLSIYMSLS